MFLILGLPAGFALEKLVVSQDFPLVPKRQFPLGMGAEIPKMPHSGAMERE